MMRWVGAYGGLFFRCNHLDLCHRSMLELLLPVLSGVLPRTILLPQRHPRQVALLGPIHDSVISRRLYFTASSQWVCIAPLGCCRESSVWRVFLGARVPPGPPPPPCLLRGFSRSLRFSICET
jgi:hypothetical protein